MNRIAQALRALVGGALGAALVACGGGGGGGDGGSGNAVSLSPTRLSASVAEGQSATWQVTAEVLDRSAFGGNPAYVYVVDGNRVLEGEVGLQQLDATHVQATLHTSTALPAGTYDGTLQVQVCLDAGCVRQVAGSPYPVAYRLVVAAGTTGFAATPRLVQANALYGTSSTLTLQLTARDPGALAGDVYARVSSAAVDFTPEVNLARIDASNLSATLHTSASLPVGTRSGTLQLDLCHDPACGAPLIGSPLRLPYTLTVSPGPLTATPDRTTTVTVHRGGVIDTPVTVRVAGPDLDWSVGTSVPWLKPAPAAGRGAGSFTVTLDATGLDLGSYSGKVAVRSSDGQTADVAFTLEVLPTNFELTSGVPTFSAVNGTTIAPQAFTFKLDNNAATPWSASTDTPWLSIAPSSGTTPASLALQPDPARAGLASGTYTGTVVLSSPGVADKSVQPQLTLIKPTLATSVPSVTLGGPTGRSQILFRQALTATLNTGDRSYALAASATPPWLVVGPAAGTVGAAGTLIEFSVNSPAAQPGSTSTVIQLTAKVNGDTVSQPVTVNLNADQRRVVANDWRAAFYSVPGRSSLSTTVTFADNFGVSEYGGPQNFFARADVPWLKVTPDIGQFIVGVPITITADPSSLPDGVLSLGTVVVSTGLPFMEPARIRVALWKDSSALSDPVPTGRVAVATDWLRHYQYGHFGGGTIDAYNDFNGRKVGSITNLSASLGQIEVSPDGSRLYAIDLIGHALQVIDLDRLELIANWPLDPAVAVDRFTSLAVGKPNGVEVVFVGNGRAYVDGRNLGPTGIPPGSMLSLSGGYEVSVFPTGGNVPVIYDVDYSAMSGGVLMVKAR